MAEAFREHGFEGASLSVLSKATGLGKGSLYNFFPGGKEEMMDAVLADIDHWFNRTIFLPLEQGNDPAAAVSSMFEDVTAYFRQGGRVCLVGWVGLGASGDAFSVRIKGYFARWISTLAQCLETGQLPSGQAEELAEATVSGIQGAIILARSLDDGAIFTRIVGRHETALLKAMSTHSRSQA